MESDTMARQPARFFRRFGRQLARFGAARKAATAVEFALIAPVFVAVLVALLQTAVFLFAQQTLQMAAVQAGRLFMTGQAQTSNMTQTQLLNNICPQIQALFTCGSVMINVASFSSSSGATASTPTLTYSNGQVSNTWSYSPGTPGQIMVVQLIYQWPVVGGPLGFSLANLPNSKAEIMGVTAFRVEPY
jgi:Flp pilus assembly protein TadG